MITLTVLVLLALASYRVTRFIVFDSLFDGSRDKLHTFLLNLKPQLLGDKLHDLTSCTWCAGVWVSGIAYYLFTRDFEISVNAFLNIAAIAGAQGLIHAFEPGDA